MLQAQLPDPKSLHKAPGRQAQDDLNSTAARWGWQGGFSSTLALPGQGDPYEMGYSPPSPQNILHSFKLEPAR